MKLVIMGLAALPVIATGTMVVLGAVVSGSRPPLVDKGRS